MDELKIILNSKGLKEKIRCIKYYTSIDYKFHKIGFNKTYETNSCVEYIRFNKEFDYPQKIVISHKKSGENIIQSYDPNLFDSKNIGNTCVGLTIYETKLCIKKMKEKGWKNNKKYITSDLVN